MPSIHELMSSSSHQVLPGTSLGEAASRMLESGQSSVIVVDQGSVLGIVTEHDILRLMRQQVSPEQPVFGAMSHPVHCTAAGTDFRQAYREASRLGIRHIVVLSAAGEPLGVVSETDLRRHLGQAFFSRLHQVDGLMEHQFPRLPASATLADALVAMETGHGSCLVVIEAQRPIGVVTERDILRLYAGGKTDVRLDSVMSTPVRCIREDASLSEAVTLMQAHAIRHLVVIDASGHLVGLLSEHAMLRLLRLDLIDQAQDECLHLAHEQDQAQVAKARNERYQQALLDNFPFLVWLKDTESRFLAVNQTYADAVGEVASTNLVGKTDLDFWPIELAERYRADDARIMATRQPLISQEPIAAHGQQTWYETYKAPVFDDQGQLLGTVGFAQDISDKHRAEEAMVLRNAALAGLIRGEPLPGILELLALAAETELPGWRCAILIADASGQFLSPAAAPRLPEAYGQSRQAIPIAEGADIFGTAAARRQRVIVADLLNDPRGATERDLARDCNIQTCWAEPIIGPDGSMLGTFGAYHATSTEPDDETQAQLIQTSHLASLILSHRRNTAELQSSRDTFRGIFDSISEALFIQDIDGNFLDANAGAEQMLGFTRDEMVNRTHATFGVPGLNALDIIDQHIAHAFARTPQNFEFWLQHKNGRIFPSEVRLHHGDYFGQPVVIASVLDISDRKRAALHLEIEHDLAQALASGHSRQDVLNTILNAALRFPELDAGSIYNRQPDGSYRLAVHQGLSADFISRNLAFGADSRQAKLIQEGKLICACSETTAYCNHEHLIATPNLQAEGLSCLAVLPVCIDGQSVACLSLAGRQTHQISQETLHALQTLAGNFAQTLLRLDAQEEAARLQHNLGGLFNTLTDFLFVFDHDGDIHHYNQAVADKLGYGQTGLQGQSLIALIPADKRVQAAQELIEIREGRRQTSELPLSHANGQRINVSTRIIAGYWDGAPAYFGIAQDISDRLIAEERQKLAASVFDNAHEGIMITDPEGMIVEVNTTFSELTGYSREEAVGQTAALLKSGHHDAEFYQAMWQIIRDKGYWRGEVWNRKKTGEIFVEQLTISTVRNRTGDIANFVGIFSDITLLKEHQQRLERLAHFDALTQLPNRMLLADRMQLAMAQSERSGNMLAVCYLDLDGFKPVNDQYGHATGDRLLIDVAHRLKACVRAGDTVSRLGGDEFVLLFSGLADVHECDHAIGRVIGQLTAPFRIGEYEISISASLGITLYPQDGSDSDTLLRHADQAMYAAKQAGRNRYHLFDPENDRRARAHREKTGRLRQALESREFVLYYQPKINMRQGRVIGAEALIRWQHPEQGLLQPADFLPSIEGSDLAVALGDWVLGQALDQLAEWHRQGLQLSVSVNISGNHLLAPGFAARLGEQLAAHPDAPPEYLELEVLETAALEDIGNVAALFAECRRFGVHFSLDDFGTGYSSLTYFRRLPADILKIDQSFVRDMLDDPDDLAIVEGVIGLTQAFQRKVIAEGVETVEHGMVLLQLGCDMAQGYGIARPMPAAELPAWIENFQPEELWNSITAFHWTRDDLPLLVAEMEHLRWLARLDAWLADTSGTLTAPNSDEHQCRFGRWLHSDQSLPYRNKEGFVALVGSHRELHRLAKQLLDPGQASDQEQLRAELAGQSRAMSEQLQQIQAEILISRQDR